MKRKTIIIPTILILLLVGIVFFKNSIILDSLGIHIELPFTKKIEIPDTYTVVDSNHNGVSDALDIVHTARVEVENRTNYESNYYSGGYPPDDEGVCTDVIWRGLKGIDVDLKTMMDKDIAENVDLYPRVNGKPDPNIDFRRVPNQYAYFERHYEVLTTELKPYDVNNLEQWQPGDIVLFLGGFHHVAIISDRRAKDGTPYIIHNTQPFASEIKLSSISEPIVGHYRLKYDELNS